MKKLLCVCLALAMLLSVSGALATTTSHLDAIKAAGKLVVATSPDYAPYEFQGQDGNPVGSDMTLAKYIADKLGVTLEIQAMDFDAVLAAIATGKVDLAISGLVPKEERKESMDFSDIYFNDGNQVIVIRKTDVETLKTLADFKGKTVAAQNGTLQKDLVTKQLPDATLELITKVPDAITMLMTGKVDGVALASVVADQTLASNPDLAICETPFEYTPLGVVVAVPKGEQALLDAVNAAVKEVVDGNLYLPWVSEASDLYATLNQ